MESWREELYHHGIKGQKWGVRRYQDKNGDWTEEGLKRRREGSGLSGSSGDSKTRSNAATVLKTLGFVAAAGATAYGVKKLSDNGYFDNVKNQILDKVGVGKKVTQRISSGIDGDRVLKFEKPNRLQEAYRMIDEKVKGSDLYQKALALTEKSKKTFPGYLGDFYEVHDWVNRVKMAVDDPGSPYVVDKKTGNPKFFEKWEDIFKDSDDFLEKDWRDIMFDYRQNMTMSKEDRSRKVGGFQSEMEKLAKENLKREIKTKIDNIYNP